MFVDNLIKEGSKILKEKNIPSYEIDSELLLSKVINKDQIIAGTDCGFSTFAGFGNVDENIVYKKLESLVRGAELASKII